MDRSFSSLTASEINDSILTTTSDLDFEGYERMERLITKVAALLADIIAGNKKDRLTWKMDCFCVKKIPSISLEEYIRSLVRETQIEPSTLILAVIYLDKLTQSVNYVLSYHSVYKLFVIALLLSAKFNEDKTIKLSDFAKYAKMNKSEVIQLEYIFLINIGFSLYVDAGIYSSYEEYTKKEDN
ncbi:MAG: cyclin [archaeon]|nr:cyclin [archaeon]